MKNGMKDNYALDVDFNFEGAPRCFLLRLHYACKDPLKFNNFLYHIYSFQKELKEKKIPHDIFFIHDAQGQTPYHIFLTYKNHETSCFGSALNLVNFDSNH